MRRALRIVLVACGLGAAAAAALLLPRTGGRSAGHVRATLSVTGLLGSGDTAGFARALVVRPLHFPVDHGPHPAFRNEWWYFTGNLLADGRVFGYELTFFRTALTADSMRRPSEWAARDVYMAHFAITDSAAGRFEARERFARGAVGLAGAGNGPWRVWVEDWRAESRAASSAFWPITLTARDSGMALRLTLGAGKLPVLEGDRGLSRKGPQPGNASYYYSLTRMPTTGSLEIGGRVYQVAGESWLDREWSTSALAPDEVGWDWFALRLSDGRDLMLYRIRRRDGGISPFSAGTVVAADGGARPLAAADFAVAIRGAWTSPRDGARYPAEWQVRVPSAGLDLRVRPVLPDQELNLAVRYWEGAVSIQGTSAGQPVSGRGYVELTGYGPQPGTSAAGGQPGPAQR